MKRIHLLVLLSALALVHRAEGALPPPRKKSRRR